MNPSAFARWRVIAAVVLVLVLLGSVWVVTTAPWRERAASVTVDAITGEATQGTGEANLTWEHPSDPDADLLLVAVGIHQGERSVNEVSYAGRSLSPVSGSLAASGTNDGQQVELWFLAGPPTGNALVDVSLTGDGATPVTGVSASFLGADIAAPLGAPVTRAGSDTDSSVVVPSASDGVVFTAVVAGGGLPSPPSEAIQPFSHDGGPGAFGGATALPGAPEVPVNWTLRPGDYALTAVAVLPARPGRATSPVVASSPLIGGVMTTSATVVYETAGVSSARLVVATDRSLTREVAESAAVVPDPNGYARLSVEGLRPMTRYYFGLAANGGPVLPAPRGEFSTFPEDAPGSFSFAYGACLDDAVDGDVFDEVVAAEPAFFMPIGDFGYFDSVSDRAQTFRNNYERMLAKPKVAAALGSMPSIYVWDDHDYGPNDSGAESPTRAAVNEAYRQRWPSYPLTSSDGIGIWQTFTYGPDVRFVVLDERSHQNADSLLGRRQRQWLKDTVAGANEAVIFLVSSIPWVASEPGDGWADWPAERTELVDAWTAAGKIDRMVVLAGDMHAIAADDGSHSAGGIPVFQAAPLGRQGETIKGGPYSSGEPIFGAPNNGQFGLVTVTQTAGGYDVRFRGRNQSGQDVLDVTHSVARNQ